jgi:hypothetical protein
MHVWNNLVSPRYKFIKSLHPKPLWKIIGIGWVALSTLSTLTVVIPDRYAHWLYVFRWPWHWYAISFLGIALAGLFETTYRNREASEGVQITASDWKALSKQFDEFVPSYVRAEWYSETLGWDGKLVGEQWLVRDDWSDQFAPRCEALCRMAGAMLLKSPHVSLSLSRNVKTRSDDARRWLYFLAEKKGVLKVTSQGETVVRNLRHKNKGGEISNLPAISSIACLECAAKEI